MSFFSSRPSESSKSTFFCSWFLLQKCCYRAGVYLLFARHDQMFFYRDPLNTKGAVLNPLKVETDAEKELFQIGHNNMLKRKETAKDSLFKHPPSEHEKEIIHDFFIQTVDHSALSFKSRIKPEKSVWMEDAKLKNLVVCQPENRNRFNKIFGGFIMR